MGIDQLDTDEIMKLIDWVSSIGGDSIGGITRLLYSNEWIDTQNELKSLMEGKGLHAYFDEVGNLFGRLEANKYKDETILTGSHIDTVANGGKLDGQLGIIAGIVALEYLSKHYGQPLRNIEVVSMAEEEGSRFPFTFWGSKNIVGSVKREEVEHLKDAKHTSFTGAMQDAGFNFKDVNIPSRKDLKAFIELHVEQGGVLEFENTPIGIVEHIVGQRRYNIEVDGEANHAGTTPMGYRKDALHATSSMIKQIMEKAIEYGDPLVATVGSLEVVPNTVNVVPGKTIFSLDIRHTSKETLVKFSEEINKLILDIASKMGVKADISMYMDEDPVAMDSGLVDIIKSQCKANGLKYKLMHSGAGHDSQIFAKHVPTSMIFVPSHKGISHNPAEFTEPKDLVEGIKALIETLYTLGYR